MNTTGAIEKNLTTHRITPLDGIRGLAVPMVIFHHTANPPNLLVTGEPIASSIHNLRCATWSGLNLFFVLSGFLITGILRQSRSRPGYLKNFYMRRVLRIFPLYYATILAFPMFLLVLGRYIHEAQNAFQFFFAWRLPWLLIYAPNVAMGLNQSYCFTLAGISLDHFWSLAVEEQFYLIWPAGVLLLNRRQLAYLCIMLISGAIAFRISLFYGTQNLFWVKYQLPSCMDGLAMGALAQLFVESGRHLSRQYLYLLLTATSVITAIAFTSENAVYLFGYSAISAAYAMLILVAVKTPVGGIFSNRILVTVGRYSYGMYVLHVPMLPFLGLYFSMYVDNLLLFSLFTMLVSFIAALISWHLLESRFLALKRFFDPVELRVPPESAN